MAKGLTRLKPLVRSTAVSISHFKAAYAGAHQRADALGVGHRIGQTGVGQGHAGRSYGQLRRARHAPRFLEVHILFGHKLFDFARNAAGKFWHRIG
jgi:hypothetical protein